MSAPAPVCIADVRLVDGPSAAGVGRFALRFEQGRVAAVEPLASPAALELRRGAARVDGGGLWLLPGWLDLQVNDIEWLARGLRSSAAHAERILEVTRLQAARGVTGLVLATLAAPREELFAYLRGMRAALDRAGAGGLASAFLGGLVEGSFMNPAFHGAHNPAHVLPPSVADVDALADTGALRLINIAPETSDEALAAIARAHARGLVVGVGHAKPSAERLRSAIAAGLRYVIHLGNGPTGSSLKPFGGGGLLEEALANDELMVSLIIDGWHLAPRLVRDILERKGPQRVFAVSDAGFAAGAPSGDFELLGVRGRVEGGGAYLRVVPPAGVPPPNPHSSDAPPLFGSSADMRRVVETILDLATVSMEGIWCRRHPALPLAEALALASRLSSSNPAALLGEQDRGHSRPGARADAILAEISGEPGRWRVAVERVWVGGEEVATAPS